MSKYDALYFVGDNQAINRVRVDSSKTRNRGAFSSSLAALKETHTLHALFCSCKLQVLLLYFADALLNLPKVQASQHFPMIHELLSLGCNCPTKRLQPNKLGPTQ